MCPHIQIQVLVLDLNKQHAHYQKTHNKYAKLVRDTELAVKAREEAIVQFAAKMNRSDKEAASAQHVTSYLNRGLNKMISKIIPTDDFKTIHDRCRSLLTSVEDLEVKLAIQSDRLVMLHAQLQDKAVAMNHQVEVMEEQRLEHTKDGLLRFCQASEGMLEHNKNILNVLRELTTAAGTESTNITSTSSIPGNDTGVGNEDMTDKEMSGRSEDMVSLEIELALLVNIMRDTDSTYDNNVTSRSSSSSSTSNQSVSDLVSVLSEEGNEQSAHEGPVSSPIDLDLSIEIHLHSFEKLKSALSILGNINYQVGQVHAW